MAFFDIRYKLRVHILALVIIVIVIGLSVPRLFMKGQPRTRANTIALAMVRPPKPNSKQISLPQTLTRNLL